MSRARADLPDARDHRRRTTRQSRHEARAWLHTGVFGDDILEDADARCPRDLHDLGRHASPAPLRTPKEGRRSGFKVWKTPYWKRRTTLRSQRNRELRRILHAP
jgi:hypothetical protein